MKTVITLCLMLFLLSPALLKSQVFPTFLDAYSYNPNQPTEIAYKTDFRTDANNWSFGKFSDGKGETSMYFNTMRFRSGYDYKSTLWRFFDNNSIPLDLSHDYIFKTNIDIIGANYNSAFYVMWGENFNNRYCFGFKIMDGSFNYDVCHNGVWSQVFVKRGFESKSEYNYIEIRKKGDSVSFIVNQKLIGTAHYTDISTKKPDPGLPLKNMFGYAIQSESTMESNSISIYQNRYYSPAQDSAYFLSYSAGAASGDTNAVYQLANMYWQGAGVKQDKAKALQLYLVNGAVKNHVPSMANVAFIYKKSFESSGNNSDKEKAVSWYKKAITLSDDWRYWSDYMELVYPYINAGERGYYSFTNLPPSQTVYLADRAAREKRSTDAQFRNRPLMALKLVNIDHANENNCYVADARTTIRFKKVNAVSLKPYDYYFDEPSRQLICYTGESSLTEWAKNQVFLNALTSSYRIELQYTDPVCKVCEGKGSFGGGYGTYSVSVPTGTYTTTTHATIVGQTENVVRTPNYSTVNVNGYIPPKMCSACGGSGKLPKQCLTQIRIIN